MSAISKKLCGAVLGIVMLFGATLCASAANGANAAAGVNAPQLYVRVGPRYHHHHWYYHHHHRYYWR
ncbi:MAG TPA: hypothetical protein VLZ81_06180 [Blastocatellia bacterium]|nr:hypothetical protein [Blastocatellia bacterium]